MECSHLRLFIIFATVCFASQTIGLHFSNFISQTTCFVSKEYTFFPEHDRTSEFRINLDIFLVILGVINGSGVLLNRTSHIQRRKWVSSLADEYVSLAIGVFEYVCIWATGSVAAADVCRLRHPRAPHVSDGIRRKRCEVWLKIETCWK